MAKSTILFDVMDNILVTKSNKLYIKHIEDLNFKDCTTFMLCKYMTMSQDKRIREFILNHYCIFEKMDVKILYKILMNSLPKQYSGFIKYIR